MKKSDADNTVKVFVVNSPTKDQSEERIKKLSEYLGQIWNKPDSIR